MQIHHNSLQCRLPETLFFKPFTLCHVRADEMKYNNSSEDALHRLQETI